MKPAALVLLLLLLLGASAPPEATPGRWHLVAGQYDDSTLNSAAGARVVTRSTMFRFDTQTGRCWWLNSYTIASKGHMNWVEIPPPDPQK